MLERLDYIRLTPARVLVATEYSAHTVLQLQHRYPNAIIQTVCNLAELNACDTASYDLMITHFLLASVSDPLQFLQHSYRILKNDGLLLLTTLGPDTFLELRSSLSAVDTSVSLPDFSDMHHVGDWLRQVGFTDPVVDREEVMIAYDDMNMLFLDFGKTAALSDTLLQHKIVMHYVKFKNDDGFPVTVEMIYGHGWKLQQDPQSQAEFLIAVDDIPVRRRN